MRQDCSGEQVWQAVEHQYGGDLGVRGPQLHRLRLQRKAAPRQQGTQHAAAAARCAHHRAEGGVLLCSVEKGRANRMGHLANINKLAMDAAG